MNSQRRSENRTYDNKENNRENKEKKIEKVQDLNKEENVDHREGLQGVSKLVVYHIYQITFNYPI